MVLPASVYGSTIPICSSSPRGSPICPSHARKLASRNVLRTLASSLPAMSYARSQARFMQCPTHARKLAFRNVLRTLASSLHAMSYARSQARFMLAKLATLTQPLGYAIPKGFPLVPQGIPYGFLRLSAAFGRRGRFPRAGVSNSPALVNRNDGLPSSGRGLDSPATRRAKAARSKAAVFHYLGAASIAPFRRRAFRANSRGAPAPRSARRGAPAPPPRCPLLPLVVAPAKCCGLRDSGAPYGRAFFSATASRHPDASGACAPMR